MRTAALHSSSMALTQPFMLPFIGLTAPPSAGRIVVELPALIALLVYAPLGWVIVKLIWLVFCRPSARSISTYRRTE